MYIAICGMHVSVYVFVCMYVRMYVCIYCMYDNSHKLQVSRNHLREIAELTVSLHLKSLPISKVCCIHRYCYANTNL